MVIMRSDDPVRDAENYIVANAVKEDCFEVEATVSVCAAIFASSKEEAIRIARFGIDIKTSDQVSILESDQKIASVQKISA